MSIKELESEIKRLKEEAARLFELREREQDPIKRKQLDQARLKIADQTFVLVARVNTLKG